MPKIIWLTKDREDPDCIIWQNHQPEVGVAYMRADRVEMIADQVLDKINGVVIKK